uniref:Guanylate cyclase domain-containing protein n=1 Tax=Cryptomonas curvata TaxID=233186 RepID=A0A7S0QQI9_9CRYP|mmetsp:Transcript_44570/g.93266  ORF Transcript_44570/g.93266 Transcript_44570/m.93266 type:complete len:485 (+) Transcript_44570:53-1507(+)
MNTCADSFTVLLLQLKLSSKPPPEVSRAVVLQLDIVQFTVLSQTLKPMELAMLVHAIFSRFDAAVKTKKLFKMDTVGDAYVVAGLLPEDGDAGHVCREMLQVAREMLEGLEQIRHETGRNVRCRIGIAVGSVLCGILGRLQPRFHVFGHGIRAAEKLEQTGTPDSVHASDGFVDALAAADELAACNVRSTGVPRAARIAGVAEVTSTISGNGLSGASYSLWGAAHPPGWHIMDSVEHLDCIAPKKRTGRRAAYATLAPVAAVGKEFIDGSAPALISARNHAGKILTDQGHGCAVTESNSGMSFQPRTALISPRTNLPTSPDTPMSPIVRAVSAPDPYLPPPTSFFERIISIGMAGDGGRNKVRDEPTKSHVRRYSSDPLQASPAKQLVDVVEEAKCWRSYVLTPDIIEIGYHIDQGMLSAEQHRFVSLARGSARPSLSGSGNVFPKESCGNPEIPPCCMAEKAVLETPFHLMEQHMSSRSIPDV